MKMGTQLQLLMPMAGLGSRFVKEGYNLPKPLIMVNDFPMFALARQGLAPLLTSLSVREIFIVLREHDRLFSIGNHIRRVCNSPTILFLDSPTRGPLETCQQASGILEPNLPLLVLDCDLTFKSIEYCHLVSQIVEGNSAIDGVLPYFESQSPQYGYIQTDENGFLKRIAEKQVISNKAVAGAYFFASTKDFLDSADKVLATIRHTESYLSLALNEMLMKGKKISSVQLDEYNSFGTPSEFLQSSLNLSTAIPHPGN